MMNPPSPSPVSGLEALIQCYEKDLHSVGKGPMDGNDYVRALIEAARLEQERLVEALRGCVDALEQNNFPKIAFTHPNDSTFHMNGKFDELINGAKASLAALSGGHDDQTR